MHSQNFGRSLLTFARRLVCMVLLFVRIPLRLVCGVLVGPMLLSAMVGWMLFGWSNPAPAILVGLALGMFALGYAFDSVLMWVSPDALLLEV